MVAPTGVRKSLARLNSSVIEPVPCPSSGALSMKPIGFFPEVEPQAG